MKVTGTVDINIPWDEQVRIIKAVFYNKMRRRDDNYDPFTSPRPISVSSRVDIVKFADGREQIVIDGSEVYRNDVTELERSMIMVLKHLEDMR
jgi:hypothetical protein